MDERVWSGMLMRVFFLIGIFLVLLGLVFITIPLLDHFLSIEDIPWWLILVYKGDNVYFATSPILILITVLFLLFRFIFR